MLDIQIKEILEYTKKVDEAISAIYAKFSESAHNQLAGQLAEYLGRHYKRMSEVIGTMSEEKSSTLLSAYVPYGPQPADIKRLEDFTLEPDSSVDDLLDRAIELDGKLVEMFKMVLDEPVGLEVKELFEKLVKHEEGDQANLRKIKAYY